LSKNYGIKFTATSALCSGQIYSVSDDKHASLRFEVYHNLILMIYGKHKWKNILRRYWKDDLLELQEEFKIMLLNRYDKVIGMFTVSSGGIAGTVADPKLIFGCALKAAASGIVLAHNHPSGALKPSQADIELTKKLTDGGQLLDIQVLDHFILTNEAYYSFADEGLL
jgi:DNA repair protein RadC